ncbi:hypothetical protein HHK36_008362 [Tetracentron sinense]|uniref:Uncharacterized protein n=1 Tax=Tetracentron sinense TaxID=13715 RepID=A0A835DN42_TETSI|nr:hypothetical protein HHK36_008362 [Tetracentron sinense]
MGLKPAIFPEYLGRSDWDKGFLCYEYVGLQGIYQSVKCSLVWLTGLLADRYMDGERLTVEDEKAVVEKLLAFHPHSEDKIGCGLDSIMVDRHPQFRQSRCLFVIRTDGGWIDFSYQKCLRAYIRDKYPSHAERFIREHFKRSSS